MNRKHFPLIYELALPLAVSSSPNISFVTIFVRKNSFGLLFCHRKKIGL
jgi:hypothetical protein